jgi:fibronectin type 3 domain-containing protein
LNNSEFSISGITFPVTIAPGQSVPFTLTFAPQSSGTANGVLSFTSNASNAPTETLTGNGVAPPSHSTSLSWTDGNTGVTGYNVYRGAVSGGPYAKINSALDANPAYTDTSVQAGQTYYYVTTAVDGSGMESGYSNEAQAVIPTP